MATAKTQETQAPAETLAENTVVDKTASLAVRRYFTIPGRPVRRDRMGDPRRLHPRQGEAGLRPEGRRVPEVLVANCDKHRRPEVFPRPHDLARARAERQADDRPGRRHDLRLGPRRR